MKYLLLFSCLWLFSCHTTRENLVESQAPLKPKNGSTHDYVADFEPITTELTQEQVVAMAEQKMTAIAVYKSIFPEQIVLADWVVVHQAAQASLEANHQSSDYASRVAHVGSTMLRKYLLVQPQPFSSAVKQALNYYITELDGVARYTPAFVEALPTLQGYRSNQDLLAIANRAIAGLQAQNQSVQTVASTATDAKATQSTWSSTQALVFDTFIGSISQHQSLITRLQTFVAGL